MVEGDLSFSQTTCWTCYFQFVNFPFKKHATMKALLMELTKGASHVIRTSLPWNARSIRDFDELFFHSIAE